MRSRRAGLFIASHNSLRFWTLIQKSALVANTRANISAVSAVMARRLLHNSLTCLRVVWAMGHLAVRVWVEIDVEGLSRAVIEFEDKPPLQIDANGALSE